MANLKFSAQAWEDYLYWQACDKKKVKRINALLKDCVRNPYEGIGKPEPLKGNFTTWWSRRISEVDRMVYKFENNTLIIAQLRYRY
ncbi:MAG: Txe/YoeB family addiction module toxin [Sedimentisphaeraceae bacterium JB056]